VDPGPEQELFERALAIRRQIGDQAGVAESLLHLGWVHQVLRGEADVSMPLFREALAFVQPDGDVHVRSELHRHIGFHLAMEDRRSEKALPHFETSLELWRSLGEPAREVFGLVALARCDSDAGRHREALAHSREALELARQGRFRARVVTAAESTRRTVEDAARRALQRGPTPCRSGDQLEGRRPLVLPVDAAVEASQQMIGAVRRVVSCCDGPHHPVADDLKVGDRE